MPYRQRKARPTEIHTPWFRHGSMNVAGMPRLAICEQCKRLFNKWDAHFKTVQTPYGPKQVVLCYWCWNGVEPCKVCHKFYLYGSLDFTKICQKCRQSGRWLQWEDEHGTKVSGYHR